MRLALSAGAIAMCALLTPADASAAFCSDAAQAGDLRHDFQFVAGFSPSSPTIIGIETDRRFALAGFSYSFRCWAWNSVSIGYTGEILPVAILIQPGGHAVYGFGVTPLGFTMDFARRRKIHPFAELNLGIIASTEPIPERQPDATGLNFLVDLGAGVRWKTGKRTALSAGYKFLHISNAFTTNFNPGVDNNVFYVGYSLLR
jgi:hypothetical protein